MDCCFLSIRCLLRDYEKVIFYAVVLTYIQMACCLIGSLGAFYNGVLLVNLVVAFFALIAIESNNQILARTYAFLLACGILLDVVWFILFSYATWNMSSEKYGPILLFSVKLALAMQIVGFAVRLLSSLLWIQIYRLGTSSLESTNRRCADYEALSSLSNHSNHVIFGQNSGSDDFLDGSIYDGQCFSSIFEDVKDCTFYSGEKKADIL